MSRSSKIWRFLSSKIDCVHLAADLRSGRHRFFGLRKKGTKNRHLEWGSLVVFKTYFSDAQFQHLNPLQTPTSTRQQKGRQKSTECNTQPWCRRTSRAVTCPAFTRVSGDGKCPTLPPNTQYL